LFRENYIEEEEGKKQNNKYYSDKNQGRYQNNLMKKTFISKKEYDWEKVTNCQFNFDF